MKIVMNNRNVTHVWAAQSQPEARGPSIFAEGPILYSYGYHFALGVFTGFSLGGERVVVLNTQSRSVTTSKHQSYTSGALSGHAVRIIHVDGIDRGEALQLADGSQGGLRFLARRLADTAREAFEGIPAKRSPREIANRLETVSRQRDALTELRTLAKTRADQKAFDNAVGTLPDVPSGSPWYEPDSGSWRPAVNDAWVRDFARVVRDEARRDEARKQVKEALAGLRHHWRGARNAYSTPVNVTTQADHARFAAHERKRLDDHIGRAEVALPGNIPSMQTIERLRAKLAIPAALFHGRADLEKMRISERAHRAAFAKARRMRKSLGTLKASGYVTQLLRGIRTSFDVSDRLRGLEMVCVTLNEVVTGRVTAEYWKTLLSSDAVMNREAAAILETLTREASGYLQWARTAERIAHAWQDQANLVSSESHLRALAKAANHPDASPSELQRAIYAAEALQEARADYVNTYPTHVLPLWPSVADVAVWRGRQARAGIVSSVAQVERKAQDARDEATDAHNAAGANMPFAAARKLSDAIAHNGTALSLSNVCADTLQGMRADAETSGGDLADLEALRVRLVAAREQIEKTDARFAWVQGEVNAARERMRAAMPAGDTLEVYAWRMRDTGAPTPQGNPARFRIGRNGDIESNMGAVVTVRAARRLWALIRAVVESGKARTWSYGTGPRVGAFHLESIASDGATKVGCHSISASEARAFAQFMQWPPFGAEISSLDALPSLADVETFAAE